MSYLLPIAALYLLWVLYVFVMSVKQRWADLPMASKILGAPVALVGYALDVAINWSIAVVVFMDLPHEKTLTERLHRYTDGWRHTVARFICQHLLNPFDPEHC